MVIYMKRNIFTIVLCLFCFFGLTACTQQDKTTIDFSSKYVNLEILEVSNNNGKILVDKDTGVLYLWYREGNQYAQLTPLYNADGSLKTMVDCE